VQKTVAIVGTLDTKGQEFNFLKEQIEAHGVATLVIDVGILGKPVFTPDVSAAEVAKTAGEDLSELIKEGDRGHSVAVMCKGTASIVEDLYRKGKFHGLISMGGGAGTNIGTAAMRALPTGVPKLMVSTIASGDTQPYVGSKDITMMPSIVDISGINRLSRQILANAAGAIAGMVKTEAKAKAQDKPLIAVKLGYPVNWLTRLRKEGIIRPIKPGSFWLYSEEQVRQIPALIAETRKCKQCGKPRPLGSARFCKECSQYRKKHRYEFLSPETKARHREKCQAWKKANQKKKRCHSDDRR